MAVECMFQFNFTVSVDTRKLNTSAMNDSGAVPLLEDKSGTRSSTTTGKPFSFENIPPEKLYVITAFYTLYLIDLS